MMFSLDSGNIHLKLTSLHRKELVLTDRPLRHCQSMKSMNEQSDLIVLTLELKEQKVRACASGRHDARKFEKHQRKMLQNTLVFAFIFTSNSVNNERQ